ncbi:MAG: FHA domain-containing protein [Gloeomargarita sp. DG_2_bins_126]
MDETIHVQLSWNDPATGAAVQHTYTPPITFGREFDQMPARLGGKPVNRIVLADRQVSRYHALISSSGGQVILTDRSANGTGLNGESLHQTSRVLHNQDVIRLGSHRITVMLMTAGDPDATHITAPTTATPALVGAKRGNNNSGIMMILALILILAAAAATWGLVSMVLEQVRPKTPGTSSVLSLPQVGEA